MKLKIKKALTILLMLTILAALLSSCTGKAPALEDIYDRVVSLIEASDEINQIFFGEGFSTYSRETPITERALSYSEEYDTYYLIFEDEEQGEIVMYYEKGEHEPKFVQALDPEPAGVGPLFVDPVSGARYYAIVYEVEEPEYVYDDDDAQNYLVVSAEAEYLSIEQIKEAAGRVYSAEYLSGIYEAAFDGIASYNPGVSNLIPARFIEQGGYLRQHEDIEPLITKTRIYDYSTMKINKPSNSKYINLSIKTSIEGVSGTLTVKLTLVYENGDWYLNSPTY